MKNSEIARRLAASQKTGTLATQSQRLKGYPFASIAPYVVDSKGNPVFLISSLAIHTKNIEADPRVSLLIFDEEAVEDPLSGSRMNLLGRMEKLEDAAREAMKPAYLAAHPSSEQWIDFGDFGMYRLNVEDVYVVAGFGKMGWVLVEDYQAAAAS